MAFPIVSAAMKIVTLVLGAVVLTVLTIWFNDNSITSEREVLTYISILLLGMVSLAALLRAAGSVGRERRLLAVNQQRLRLPGFG